jgi:hypothetical protein
MKIDGSCHCGYITYEAEVDPEKVSICHCADCQTLSGAPFRASVAVAAADFRFLSGEAATYVKTADSGNRRAQTFCPTCGSPIYSADADDPNAPRALRLGGIRQRDSLVPRRQIWGRSRQRWVDDLGAIERLDGQA